ncbi:MAG: hypothetical protein H6706_20850 [Myxococcales bacterium]|nr:hypothetical protein [Myxococcales bacterium]
MELGQLAFVAALLGLRRLLPAAVAARARPVGVLAMGSLAGFWLWARVAAFWAVWRRPTDVVPCRDGGARGKMGSAYEDPMFWLFPVGARW